MTRIKDEVGRFLETTSMKGIPRMVKSQGAFLRTLWLVGFVMLASLALWLAINQIVSYFSFNVVTVVKEVNLLNLENMINNLGLPAFFAITICNLKPQPSAKLWRNRSVQSVYEYRAYMANMEQQYKTKLSQADYMALQPVFRQLVTFGGYYSQFEERPKLEELGYNYDDIFVECYYRVLAEGGQEDIACDQVSNVRQFSCPEHFNCYVIEINSTRMLELQKQAFSMSAILYLDNMETFIPPNWSESAVMQKYGALLYISLPGQLPDLTSAVNLAPGFETKVKVMFQIRKRKPKPYGQCRAGQNNIVDLLGQHLSYTVHACMRMCMQNVTYIACGCLTPSLHVTPSDVDDNPHFCGRIPQDNNLSKVAEEMQCAASTASRSREGCYKNCHGECTELQDQSVISQTNWPQINTHLSFYNDVIKTKPYAEYFKDYEAIQENYAATGNSSEALRSLDDLNLIRRNFLKFHLVTDGSTANIIEDNAAITVSTLLSQLGGILNLYTGITALLVIEIIELAYHILVKCVFNRGQKTTMVKPFKKPEDDGIVK